MDDLMKSIKAHLYDKATSPLFGTFMASWVFWNYKLVFVLFSSEHFEKKFKYISSSIYTDTSTYLLPGFLYPLATTLFFIFVYPYPAMFVYKFWRNRQRELKEIKQQIEDETPLTKEESRAIRSDVAKLQTEYEKELEGNTAEVQKLKDRIEQLEEESINSSLQQLGIKPAENEEISTQELNTEQFTLLKYIASNDQTFTNDILQWSNLDKITTEYNMGLLLNRGLIKIARMAGGTGYRVTHNGRELLVTNKDSETSEE